MLPKNVKPENRSADHTARTVSDSSGLGPLIGSTAPKSVSAPQMPSALGPTWQGTVNSRRPYAAQEMRSNEFPPFAVANRTYLNFPPEFIRVAPHTPVLATRQTLRTNRMDIIASYTILHLAQILGPAPQFNRGLPEYLMKNMPVTPLRRPGFPQPSSRELRPFCG